METIRFSDANDIVTTVSIAGKRYKLRFLWNELGAFWVMHVWDADKNPILCNMKLIPGFPISFNHHCADIPRGEFIIVTDLPELERSSFADNKATLVYVEEGEWLNGTV